MASAQECRLQALAAGRVWLALRLRMTRRFTSPWIWRASHAMVRGFQAIIGLIAIK